MAFYNRGLANIGLTNWERAIEDFTRTIDLEPDFGPAYNNRGGTWINLNEFEKAINDLNHATNLDS